MASFTLEHKHRAVLLTSVTVSVSRSLSTFYILRNDGKGCFQEILFLNWSKEQSLMKILLISQTDLNWENSRSGCNETYKYDVSFSMTTRYKSLCEDL